MIWEPPVIGATVIVQGTVNGVLTDIDGKYAIEAKKNQVLEYRLLVTKEWKKLSEMMIVLM